jgi:YD repeat-containing protein
MTYDGYGRLSSRHVPEQDAGTATVYVYNSDDSVSTMTDARGASVAYSYNKRHLPTSVTYTAPAGVASTSNVIFAYDAVGNRTSMTDGLGNHNYSYNQLSQLVSETRVFTNVGSFSLTYDYNLAGQLKKITDASNTTINYGYDLSGQLTGVTGSDTLVGGVSTYASSFQYRAWGAPKQVSVGTHTTSLSYNSRLKATGFTISGGVVYESYDYYKDGRLSFVHNTTNINFDRAFQYDHAARIKLAATGGAARNDAGATPMYETFDYDAFDNITSRETESWLNGYLDSASYTNYRRSGWSYDAAGRVTAIDARTYSYDAAGRTTFLAGQRWTPSGYVPTTTTSGFDGDGKRVREESGGSGSPVITYYLRSSVLGGAIIEELNSSGQKQIGYVYTPSGKALATQYIGQNYVMLRQLTPTSSSQYEFFVSNTVAGLDTRREFDPLGANIPLSSNSGGHGGGAGDLSGGGGPMGSRSGAIENPAAGCALDYAWVPCSFAYRLLKQGAAEQCPENDCGPQARNYINDQGERIPWITLPFMAFANGESGYYPGFLGVTPQAQADAAPRLRALAASGAAVNTIDRVLTLGFLAQDSRSRMLSPSEVDALEGDLNQTLSNKDCKDFVKRTLEQLKAQTGQSKHGTTDILKLFEAVKKGKGFDYHPMEFEATGWGGPGQASISINPSTKWFQKSSIGRGVTLIHELFHVAGYNHDAIATAVFNMGERWDSNEWKPWKGSFPDSVPDPFLAGKERKERLEGAYSGFIKNIIDQHCK